MNVQRLIEKYKKLEGVWDAPGAETARQIFLQDLEQLDEPEKVTIPQFVVDWIEESKNSCKNVVEFFEYRNPSFEITKWIEEGERFDLIARAWLDGYEVEETKYVVTDGNHLYFKGYQEDVDIVILADEQPGTMEYVKKFDTKEEAQKAADILGWKIQEVE